MEVICPDFWYRDDIEFALEEAGLEVNDENVDAALEALDLDGEPILSNFHDRLAETGNEMIADAVDNIEPNGGDGEMPKSKWTKKAMVAAIQSYCDEFDMLFAPDLLKGMRKDEVFERFFHKSSWHHTSKFFNETDFYKLDEDAVCGSFRPMTDTEVAERDAMRRQAIEEEKAVREAMRVAEIERLNRHRAYREEHGFAPDTVAAFAHEHPECCQERVSRKGNRVLSYIDYLGHEQVCPIEHIRDTHLHGFDATEPSSFDRAIECHQLPSTRGMPGNDRITVKGEAQAMKAASAEMADGEGKHDIGLETR